MQANLVCEHCVQLLSRQLQAFTVCAVDDHYQRLEPDAQQKTRKNKQGEPTKKKQKKQKKEEEEEEEVEEEEEESFFFSCVCFVVLEHSNFSSP